MPIDNRIMRVGVEIEGRILTYEGLYISAQGSKYASATQNETTINIGNLKKEAVDFLATNGTPFKRINQRTRNKVFVQAGRESTGLSTVFSGDIMLVNPSQPPDIFTSIKAITGQLRKGSIISTSEGVTSKLSVIAKKTADAMDVGLEFTATEKLIENYSFTGAATKQVDKLNELSSVDAFIDDDVLVVKDTNSPRGTRIRVVSKSTGMIGIPEFTDFGVKVTMLFDAKIKVGDQIEIISEVYPATNGRYIIYKLDFDLSNRGEAFYYVAECRRPGGVFFG